MAKKNYRYRQGDVYLIPREKRLTDDEIKKCKKSVDPLALGEVSGHHHVVTQVIEDEKLDLSKLGDDNTTLYVDEKGNMVLRAEKGTLVEHIVEKTGEKADHEPIEVAPGDYDVVIQEEYTPEGNRRVID